MSNQPAFLPTTKPQCALVYALNGLLLFNLTVIVVMLSGPATKPQPQRSTGSAEIVGVPERRAASFDRVKHEKAETGLLPSPAEPMSHETIQLVSDQPAVFAQPDTTEDEPSADRVTAGPAKQPASKQQQTEQNDPPVTFFGVGLE